MATFYYSFNRLAQDTNRALKSYAVGNLDKQGLLNQLVKFHNAVGGLEEAYYGPQGFHINQSGEQKKNRHCVNAFDRGPTYSDPVCVLNRTIDYLFKDIKIPGELLDDTTFIAIFYLILWDLLRNTALTTKNIYEYIDQLVQKINNATRPDYIKNCCYRSGKDQRTKESDFETGQYLMGYTCGRAMLPNYEKGAATRLVIFTTKSLYDSDMDMDDFEKCT